MCLRACVWCCGYCKGLDEEVRECNTFARQMLHSCEVYWVFFFGFYLVALLWGVVHMA